MYTPYQYQPAPMYPMQQPQVQQAQTMPIQQMPSLSGRIVKSIEEIMPNDVPMNGSVAVFPAADMKAIYIKGWNPDGTISTVKYEPVKSENVEDDSSITLTDIMDQLNNIEDMLKPKKSTTAKRIVKKEVEDDAE